MKETAILLTGAGFTHNFGTPLAKEMWTEIFNNEEVQRSDNLRNAMLKNFDYESIYNDVLNGDFTEKEKEAIRIATINAYENLDDIVIEYGGAQDLQYQIFFPHVKEFIIDFFKHGAHHFFTLNQDLFLERKFINEARNDNIKLSIPGIQNYLWFDNRFDGIKSNFILPNEDLLEQNKKTYLPSNEYYYIKLHGSQNWSPSTGGNVMVIGSNKEEQIRNEPLLKWYFEIFNKILFQPNIRLLIVGYSFSDEHINKAISEAIIKYKLKIYILMPRNPDEIILDLKNKKPYGQKIINGISGFFPYKLSQIFPKDDRAKHYYKEICKHLFYT